LRLPTNQEFPHTLSIWERNTGNALLPYSPVSQCVPNEDVGNEMKNVLSESEKKSVRDIEIIRRCRTGWHLVLL